MHSYFVEIIMTDMTEEEITSRVEFYYVDQHYINESNLAEYKELFLETLQNTCFYIQFDLELRDINDFLYEVGFQTTDVSLTYFNGDGCLIAISSAYINGKNTDYYVLKKVTFTQNDRYPTSYYTTFDKAGHLISSTLTTPRKLLKNVRLKSISYEIDKETFKIKQILYFIEDNRKYQKCIDGYVAIIVEHPIKSIKEKDNVVEGINLYDVHYFSFNKGSLETIHLSDIIRQCDLKITKMYGHHFTQFLTMYKMFSKRELELIGMTFI